MKGLKFSTEINFYNEFTHVYIMQLNKYKNCELKLWMNIKHVHTSANCDYRMANWKGLNYSS